MSSRSSGDPVSARGSITLGELRGKLDILEVWCHRCDRRGRVSVAHLIAEHGAGMGLPELNCATSSPVTARARRRRPSKSGAASFIRSCRCYSRRVRGDDGTQHTNCGRHARGAADLCAEASGWGQHHAPGHHCQGRGRKALSAGVSQTAAGTRANGEVAPKPVVRMVPVSGHPIYLGGLTRASPAQAFIPPSTVRFAPVMYEDSGLATKATIAAISSGRP
jgi:hypothetical protein